MMLSTVKKYFFGGVFLALYVSFVFQFVHTLFSATSADTVSYGLGLLSGEWLALMAARYLSKKSSGGAPHHGGHFRR